MKSKKPFFNVVLYFNMKPKRVKYSLPEIREAKLTFDVIKKNNINVDTRRKSCKSKNVKKLLNMDLPQKYNPETEHPKLKKKKQELKTKKEAKPQELFHGYPAKVKIAVKTMFEDVERYPRKADLMEALEKHVAPHVDENIKKVYKTLRDKEILNYSRSKPRGYSLDL
jgi:hypothetical protein